MPLLQLPPTQKSYLIVEAVLYHSASHTIPFAQTFFPLGIFIATNGWSDSNPLASATQYQ